MQEPLPAIKFFIDECLTPELVDIARARGYTESTCSKYAGQANTRFADYRIVKWATERDFSPVTVNGKDFVGRSKARDLYRSLEIHPGIISLEFSQKRQDFDSQCAVFRKVLDFIEEKKLDLVNEILYVKDDKDSDTMCLSFEIEKTGEVQNLQLLPATENLSKGRRT